MNADALRHQALTGIVTRECSDWSEFEFDAVAKARWVTEGIPADRAHWAAMIRDATWIPGLTMHPRTRLAESGTRVAEGTVLQALENGANMVRIQFNASVAADAPHSIPLPVLHALQPRRAEASVMGSREVLADVRTQGPRELPRLLDLLVAYTRLETKAQEPWRLLCRQATRYVEHGALGRLFVTAAQAHGVYTPSEEMRLLAGAWASPDGGTAALSISAAVLQAVGVDRHLYYTKPETTHALRVIAESSTTAILEHQLPSPSGLVWLSSDGVGPYAAGGGSVLAWAFVDGELAVTLAAADQVQARLSARGANAGKVAAAQYRITSDLSAEEITKGGRYALALLSAFTRLYRSDGVHITGPNEHRGFRSRTSNEPQVVGYKYPERRVPNEIATPSSVRDTRWVVRGHWRNQWYPSLGKHQPVWIAEHEAGHESADLVQHDIVYLPGRQSVRRNA